MKNIQELKENIINDKMFGYGTNEDARNRMIEWFSKFEQSNEKETKFKFEPEYYIHKEIEGMKESISELDERIDKDNERFESKVDAFYKEVHCLHDDHAGLKIEIEKLKKQVENQKSLFAQQEINRKEYQVETKKIYDFIELLRKNTTEYCGELKRKIDSIDKLKIIDSSIEPKQERFYYMNTPDDFQLLDRKKEIRTNCYYNYSQINDLCRMLNLMEGK